MPDFCITAPMPVSIPLRKVSGSDNLQYYISVDTVSIPLRKVARDTVADAFTAGYPRFHPSKEGFKAKRPAISVFGLSRFHPSKEGFKGGGAVRRCIRTPQFPSL